MFYIYFELLAFDPRLEPARLSRHNGGPHTSPYIGLLASRGPTKGSPRNGCKNAVYIGQTRCPV